MPKKNSDIARRAWNVLRLALLWARKGGVFKGRLVMEFPKFIKNIGHSTPRDRIHFEREFSFDKTPIFPVKFHGSSSMRFHIPCLNPPTVDFDYVFDSQDDDNVSYDHYNCERGRKSVVKDEEEEEENIDSKAEEFIANFYQQIKLQRQISYLQYNEMMNRAIS
ncbi:hypothetical protein UlMin_030710 [Ulmus minor]